MPCYKPLKAYSVHSSLVTKKKVIYFRPPCNIPSSSLLSLPCGQCIGCRLEYSRQWAIRCMHESSLYENNCFITLTYNDLNVPRYNSLDVSHFQLFMKRLRKYYSDLYAKELYFLNEGFVSMAKCRQYISPFVPKIRFFHCGEYGEELGRPHYHALLFNYDFPDRYKSGVNSSTGTVYYRSDILEKLWTHGYSSIGNVTFDSAAYVARYVLKKVTGSASSLHYSYRDPDTGFVVADRKPEYVTMSRRPGIAKGWFDRYSSDVYPSDSVVLRGMEMRPPKYYDKLYELIDPSSFLDIKERRIQYSQTEKVLANNTPDRLQVREFIKKQSISRLVRNLKHGDNL